MTSLTTGGVYHNPHNPYKKWINRFYIKFSLILYEFCMKKNSLFFIVWRLDKTRWIVLFKANLNKIVHNTTSPIK